MRPRRSLAALALAAVVGAAAAGDARSYLALGDSYTIGEAVAAEARWPVVLARALSARGLAVAEPTIVARTGWTTDELAAAIDHAELAPRYELVSLLIGVNNQYRGRDADQYRREFAALLERAIGFAGDRAERVFVVSIPDWGVTAFGAASGRDPAQIAREIDAYNAINRDEAGKRGLAWIDVTAISRAPDPERVMLADDGLHPSAAQYARWAERIEPVVARLLEARQERP
jgi:lysophospholipase L1-like esterase